MADITLKCIPIRAIFMTFLPNLWIYNLNSAMDAINVSYCTLGEVSWVKIFYNDP